MTTAKDFAKWAPIYHAEEAAKREQKAQDELLENFGAEFRKLYKQAVESGGAGRDHYTPYEIGRVVLVITAEQFCYTKEGRALLANLRHFI